MKKTIVTACLLAVRLAGPLWAEGGYAARSAIEINKGYVQERLVRKAMEFLGTRYVSGGKSRKGVDCSGFVYAVYLEATGRKLPLGTTELFLSLAPVRGPLVPGDLVFFDTTGGVSHVGLAIGGSRIVHAASRGPKTGVIVSSLEEAYYRTRYLGARRVFRYTAPVLYATLGGTRIGTELAASLEAGRPLSLSVAHKRKGSAAVACRLLRSHGNEKMETRKIAIAPGKETLVTCSFEESGDWVISFTEGTTAEIMRIEVKVERVYDPAGKSPRQSAAKGGGGKNP